MKNRAAIIGVGGGQCKPVVKAGYTLPYSFSRESCPMSTTVHTTRLVDYQPPAWRIPTIELSFELDAKTTEVHALMRCERVGEAAQGVRPEQFASMFGLRVLLTFGARLQGVRGSRSSTPSAPFAPGKRISACRRRRWPC